MVHVVVQRIAVSVANYWVLRRGGTLTIRGGIKSNLIEFRCCRAGGEKYLTIVGVSFLFWRISWLLYNIFNIAALAMNSFSKEFLYVACIFMYPVILKGSSMREINENVSRYAGYRVYDTRKGEHYRNRVWTCFGRVTRILRLDPRLPS